MEGINLNQLDHSPPKTDKTDYVGAITSQELVDVYGTILISPATVLIDREAPQEQTSGGIVVPHHVRKDRQTGSTTGFILMMGSEAEAEINETFYKNFGRNVREGDRVSFPIHAPQPAGFTDEYGNPILPGFSQSRYSGLEMIMADDIRLVFPQGD